MIKTKKIFNKFKVIFRIYFLFLFHLGHLISFSNLISIIYFLFFNFTLIILKLYQDF